MGDLSAADFKASMDKLFVEITSVRDELTTLKGDQGRLTVAVNRLQSDKHKPASSGGNNDDASQPPTNSASPTMTAATIPSDGSTSVSSSSAPSARQRTRRSGPRPSTWRDQPSNGTTVKSATKACLPGSSSSMASNRRFGAPVRSNPLRELTHLRRTGIVAAYQDAFLQLLARCDDITER